MWPETERVPADSQQQGEPLSLTAHKQLSPANSHVGLKVDSFPSHALDETLPGLYLDCSPLDLETLKQRTY